MQPDVLSSNFGLLNLGSSTSSHITRRLRNNKNAPAPAQPSSDADLLVPQVEVPARRRQRSGDASIQGASGKTMRSRRPLAQHQHSNSSNTSNSIMAPALTINANLRRAGSLRGNGKLAFPPAESVDAELENHSHTHSRQASGSSAAGIKRKRPSLTSIKKQRAGSGNASYRSASSLIDSDDAPVPAATTTAPSRTRTTGSRSRSISTTSKAGLPMRRSSSSRSSLSIRQGLTNLALSERYSPEEQQSPTRSKASARGSTAGRSARTASSSSTRMLMPDSSDDGGDDSNGSQDGDASDDDENEGETQDEQLLLYASFWQLDRLRKDRLERLAAKAGLAAIGLKKAEIVELIIDHRSVESHGPPSSNTRSAKGRSSVGSSTRLSLPPSDHSADYTDEDGDDEGDGHDEANSSGIRAARAKRSNPRRGQRTAQVKRDGASPLKPSPVKRTYGRRIAGRKTTAVTATDAQTDTEADTADPPVYAPSPMLNRLRKQKSLLFAASSPLRTRARPRQTGVIVAGPRANGVLAQATSSANHHSNISPMRPRLRPRRRATAGGSLATRDKSADDQMDEDWIDSVSLSQDIKSQARKAIQASSSDDGDEDEDAEMQDDDEQSQCDAIDEDEDEGSDTFQQSSSDPESADESTQEERFRAASHRRSSSPQQSLAEDADDDSDADSDRTDGPGRNGHRAASPSSPTKMRRLRNGKLRILPDPQVEDTDVEVDAVLTTAASPTTPRPANRRRTSSAAGKAKLAAVKTVKAANTKPKTPPLSAHNAEAQSADGENLDELNGLDLESLNLTDKEIPPRQLEKSSRIGSGGFKDVYVGIWKVGKRRNKVAIADIREKLTEMDIKELGLLRDLKHENIVRFIGVSIPEDTARTGIPCMIVSELCSNGDLWDYVRGTKPPADLQVFRMLLETARGLDYLHMHSIVHRDVKSSNVLVTRNRSCKINDFGLARVKRSQRSKMKSVVGTVNWQAVELWCKAPQYNEKVDVWSAAMTFWEALQWHEEYKSYPFEGMNDFEIYEEVGKNGLRPPTDRISELYGEEIVRLLNRMWDADARKRPTMDMVCKDLERLIEIKTLEMQQ